LVKSSVGSSYGITGALGTILCPRSSKNFRKLFRISVEVILFVVEQDSILSYTSICVINLISSSTLLTCMHFAISPSYTTAFPLLCTSHANDSAFAYPQHQLLNDFVKRVNVVIKQNYFCRILNAYSNVNVLFYFLDWNTTHGTFHNDTTSESW